MIMRHTLILFALFLSCTLAYAQAPQRVPARRDPIVITQPNGDSLTILKRGDERVHWTMTTDGWQILENKKGYMCYVRLKRNGEVTLSNKKAKDETKRRPCEARWLKKHGIQKHV